MSDNEIKLCVYRKIFVCRKNFGWKHFWSGENSKAKVLYDISL